MKSSRSLARLLTVLAVFSAVTPSHAEQTSPICIYASKNYGEGAFLCVQKTIALICRSEGARSAWTIVTDRDLADRCASATEPYFRPHPRGRTAFRARRQDLSIGGGKCFEFNGKQYCE